MRGVNLLPKDAATERSKRSRMIDDRRSRSRSPFPLVALGFLYVGAHGKVSDQQSQLDAVKAEIAALPAPQGPNIDASVVG